jgi:hypothetical protein
MEQDLLATNIESTLLSLQEKRLLRHETSDGNTFWTFDLEPYEEVLHHV